MSFAEAANILEEELVGDFYSHVSVGDWWCLAFSKGQFLIAQDIVSPEETALNGLLASAEPAVLDGVDPESVAKGIVLHRNMRKEVTRIAIEDDGTLRLFFDNGRHIRLTTSTEIVDWQWCLNRSGEDPYSDYVVACFWPNEVQVDTRDRERKIEVQQRQAADKWYDEARGLRSILDRVTAFVDQQAGRAERILAEASPSSSQPRFRAEGRLRLAQELKNVLTEGH